MQKESFVFLTRRGLTTHNRQLRKKRNVSDVEQHKILNTIDSISEKILQIW